MKYIFCDIDGTLYSPKIDDIPSSAKKAMKIARENGNRIYLCTGRGLAECQKYLGYDVDGFIFAAGALIYDSKKRIFDHPFLKSDVVKLKNMLHERGIGYVCEAMAGAYADEKGMIAIMNYFCDPSVSYEKKYANAMSNGFYPEEYAHEDDPIYKICCYSNDLNQFTKLASVLPDPYILTLTVRDPIYQNHCSEITNSYCTKSTGIKEVLRRHDATFKDAVAIGDSANDIPMIRDCGLGIAMGNAFDDVKEIADFVTTDILDNGIWNAFRKAGVLGDDSNLDAESGD